MKVEAILDDDPQTRDEALAAAREAPQHLRSAFAGKLSPIAREAAAAVAAAEEAGESSAVRRRDLERLLRGLAVLHVAAAKASLLRIADEGTPAVKATLARALRGGESSEARAVLAYLLSDEDARAEAIVAIAAAPWPEVLPDLIEIAEVDDASLRLAIHAIAKCGASAGPNERNASADFLLEQLDDEMVLTSAVDALLRFGARFPGLEAQATRLSQDRGRRKIAGLCLLARLDLETPRLEALARAGTPLDEDLTWQFLGPLLQDQDPAIRQAAERTAAAVGLRTA